MHRTVCAAAIAISIIAGSQLAVRFGLEAVAKVATSESALFQPELLPSQQLNSRAYAQASNRLVR